MEKGAPFSEKDVGNPNVRLGRGPVRPPQNAWIDGVSSGSGVVGSGQEALAQPSTLNVAYTPRWPNRPGKAGNMSTLVTGGTGFVGSNIVKTLAQRGHQVVCFDQVPPDRLVKAYHSANSSSITYAQGDILDPGDLERAVAGRQITKIVHAAVFTGLRHDIERDRSRSIVDINVTGTANLLSLAMGLNLERFLYVSSGSVYGEGLDPAGVLHEENHLYPPYTVRFDQVRQRTPYPPLWGTARVPSGEHAPERALRSLGEGYGPPGHNVGLLRMDQGRGARRPHPHRRPRRRPGTIRT